MGRRGSVQSGGLCSRLCVTTIEPSPGHRRSKRASRGSSGNVSSFSNAFWMYVSLGACVLAGSGATQLGARVAAIWFQYPGGGLQRRLLVAAGRCPRATPEHGGSVRAEAGGRLSCRRWGGGCSSTGPAGHGCLLPGHLVEHEWWRGGHAAAGGRGPGAVRSHAPSAALGQWRVDGERRPRGVKEVSRLSAWYCLVPCPQQRLVWTTLPDDRLATCLLSCCSCLQRWSTDDSTRAIRTTNTAAIATVQRSGARQAANCTAASFSPTAPWPTTRQQRQRGVTSSSTHGGRRPSTTTDAWCSAGRRRACSGEEGVSSGGLLICGPGRRR